MWTKYWIYHTWVLKRLLYMGAYKVQSKVGFLKKLPPYNICLPPLCHPMYKSLESPLVGGSQHCRYPGGPVCPYFLPVLGELGPRASDEPHRWTGDMVRSVPRWRMPTAWIHPGPSTAEAPSILSGLLREGRRSRGGDCCKEFGPRLSLRVSAGRDGFRVLKLSCWATCQFSSCRTNSSTVSGWLLARVLRASGGSWRMVLSIKTRSRMLGPSPAANHLRINLLLGDLSPYGASDIESPVVEALGPGGEAMAIVCQYHLL